MKSEKEINALSQMRDDLKWLLGTECPDNICWTSSKSDLVEFVHLATFGPRERMLDDMGRPLSFKALLTRAKEKVGIRRMGKASCFLRQRQLRKQPECAFLTRYIYIADSHRFERPVMAFINRGG